MTEGNALPLVPGLPRVHRLPRPRMGSPGARRRVLFEFLILEGAQAGLSWSTILAKRENYRRLFADFDPAKVARFTPARVEKLLLDPGIVRNRLKVEGTVKNARRSSRCRRSSAASTPTCGEFVGGAPRGEPPSVDEGHPRHDPRVGRACEGPDERGFTFVGSTIMYAFMQAVGMVNDHLAGCPFHTANLR